MPSNGGPAGCWRKIDEAFHRPIMDLENTRSPARTARQTKPSKSIQARRLAYTSRPQRLCWSLTAKRRGDLSCELLGNRSVDGE
jgi:hypothetical protein